MREQVKSKRRYDATRRRERAEETKRAIVQAARALFVERGYSRTTMEAIARLAGVSVEAVYTTFGNKRSVLARVMDVEVVGDDEPVALLDRPTVVAVAETADQRKQIDMFSRQITQIMERVGPIFHVMRTAAPAEPDIAELLDGYLEKRRQGMEHFVEALSGNGPLRPNLPLDEAIDTIWTVTSAEVHFLLTHGRGWDSARYEQWLVATLNLVLLGKT